MQVRLIIILFCMCIRGRCISSTTAVTQPMPKAKEQQEGNETASESGDNVHCVTARQFFYVLAQQAVFFFNPQLTQRHSIRNNKFSFSTVAAFTTCGRTQAPRSPLAPRAVMPGAEAPAITTFHFYTLTLAIKPTGGLVDCNVALSSLLASSVVTMTPIFPV